MATTDFEFVSPAGNGICERCDEGGVRVLVLLAGSEKVIEGLCGSCAVVRGVVTAEELAADEEGRALAHFIRKAEFAMLSETRGAVCA
jgi:hypothetical protein